jgi:hypothetical protein
VVLPRRRLPRSRGAASRPASDVPKTTTTTTTKKVGPTATRCLFPAQDMTPSVVFTSRLRWRRGGVNRGHRRSPPPALTPNFGQTKTNNNNKRRALFPAQLINCEAESRGAPPFWPWRPCDHRPPRHAGGGRALPRPPHSQTRTNQKQQQNQGPQACTCSLFPAQLDDFASWRVGGGGGGGGGGDDKRDTQPTPSEVGPGRYRPPRQPPGGRANAWCLSLLHMRKRLLTLILLPVSSSSI